MCTARSAHNVCINSQELNQRVLHVWQKDTFDLHIPFGKFNNIKAL